MLQILSHEKSSFIWVSYLLEDDETILEAETECRSHTEFFPNREISLWRINEKGNDTLLGEWFNNICLYLSQELVS